jgi:hypothetical protein
MTQFTECNDDSAKTMRRQLLLNGAKHVSIVTDGALRISKSLCPITQTRWQWLVCVSRNRKPVSDSEARQLAIRFVTDHEIESVNREPHMTSVWFKQK